MTTSAQQTVLTAEEMACLRDCAEGNAGPRDAALLASVTAKGLVQAGDDRRPTLTPAGHHLLHGHVPGTVPGLDS